MQKIVVVVENLLQGVDDDVNKVENDPCHAKKDHHAQSFLLVKHYFDLNEWFRAVSYATYDYRSAVGWYLIDQKLHHEPKVQTEIDVVDEVSLRYYHTHDDDVVELEDFVGYSGDYDGDQDVLCVHNLGCFQTFDSSIGLDVVHNSSYAVGDAAADVPTLKYSAIHEMASDCNQKGDSLLLCFLLSRF